MNREQNIALWCALFLFALTLLFAPWEYRTYRIRDDGRNLGDGRTQSAGIMAAPLFSIPRNDDPESEYVYSRKLMLDVLAMEWIGICILYGGVFLVLGKGERFTNGSR